MDLGITDIVSVPCSITDSWQWLAAEAARRGELRLAMTCHEGSLAGIAAGRWFGTFQIKERSPTYSIHSGFRGSS